MTEQTKRMRRQFCSLYAMLGNVSEAALRAGYDCRHGLIGSGVYASHGYERSHMDGVLNTLKTIIGYLNV